CPPPSARRHTPPGDRPGGRRAQGPTIIIVPAPPNVPASRPLSTPKGPPMPHRVARRDGPRVRAVLALLAAAALARAPPAPPPHPQPAAPAGAPPRPAPPPKTLSGDADRKVAALSKAIDDLWRAGKFAEAVETARQAVAICEKALGPEHWRTADAR